MCRNQPFHLCIKNPHKLLQSTRKLHIFLPVGHALSSAVKNNTKPQNQSLNIYFICYPLKEFSFTPFLHTGHNRSHRPEIHSLLHVCDGVLQ